MAKMKFDKQYCVEIPTLLLQNRNFDTYGNIVNFTDLAYTENFNSPNELSFNIVNEDNLNKDNSLAKWDDIVDFRILYVPEFEERFEIKVDTEQDSQHIKTVKATSLCESELSQIILRDIEINTPDDILNPLYDENFPTIFYRNPEYFDTMDWENEKYQGKYKDYDNDRKKNLLKHSSLLHRLLEKAPHYKVGHVDKSLQNIQREFSINDSAVYDVLSGEILKEFGCIFLYDSMSRTINAYDMYNTCKDCGYRGDFSDVCPECGSKNADGQIGEDTTVFITVENLANKISIETNADSLKNCFYVEGGDDLMSAAVRSCNPNGGQYIYRNSPEMKADMPKALLQKIESYDELYEKYMSLEANECNRYFLNHPADNTDITVNYNEVVKYVKTRFPNKSYLALSNPMIGFPATTSAMYDAIDLYLFLKSSMMPEIDISGDNIETSMENIVNGFSDGFKIIVDNTTTSAEFQNEIAVSNPFVSEASYIENAISKTARLFYKKAYYDLSLIRISYTKAIKDTNGNLIAKGCWIGKFKLESLTEKDENGNRKSLTSDDITIYVSDNSELYIEQCIYRAMGDKSELESKHLTGLQISDVDFKTQLEYYSFDELSNLSSAFSTCLNLIQSILNETSMSDDWNTINLVNKYTSFYQNRLNYISAELENRDMQLSHIKAVYDYENNSGILYELRLQTQKTLDLETYLGDRLWKTFHSYRREDTYNNPNYISDGSSNSKLIQDAGHLLEAANKELYKASSPQYSITCDLNNLLELEEFKPIADHFCVGNWIRIGNNDKVYKLRLLSYSVKYDDIQSINVELSTVEKIQEEDSDLQSVINSSKSLSSTYNSLKLQNDKASNIINNYVKNWVEDGLNATKVKYVNADNQDLVIDGNGILCRMYDYLTDDYHPCQIKLVNNGLYTTSDGWNTIDSGIGRISYVDPETGRNVDTFGVIAKTVVGKLFLGENLGIYTENGTLKFNKDGLCITNGKNTVLINPNEEKLFKISNAKADCFYTDENGNINVTGNIKGSSFTGGSIDIGDGSFVVDTKGNLFTKGEINLCNDGIIYDGMNLEVKGIIHTNGGTFSGDITSTANITGGSIDIGDGNFVVDKNGNATSKGILSLADGNMIYNGSSLSISGSINATELYAKDAVRLYSGTLETNFKCLYVENEGDDTTPLHISAPHSYQVLIDSPASFTKDVYINKRIMSSLGEVFTSDTNNKIQRFGTSSNYTDTTTILRGNTIRIYAHEGGGVYLGSSGSTAITSDENFKDLFDIPNEYETFFDHLKPTLYKYKDTNKEMYHRKHIGFGARSVKESLEKSGLTTEDFAGIIIEKDAVVPSEESGDDTDVKYDELYSLRYEEFIALNTYMIKKLQDKISVLENRIEKLA